VAKREFLEQVKLCLCWIDDIGVECVPAIRFVSSFLSRHPKIPKKVREAEREWVPYTVVVGDREVQAPSTLTVRPRVGDTFEVSLEELVGRLASEVRRKPSRPLNGPRRLSRRPIFVG